MITDRPDHPFHLSQGHLWAAIWLSCAALGFAISAFAVALVVLFAVQAGAGAP